MAIRPILGQHSDTDTTQRAQSSPEASRDSPLASQLPAWDLVPAHNLLVRRRFVREQKTEAIATADTAQSAALGAASQSSTPPLLDAESVIGSQQSKTSEQIETVADAEVTQGTCPGCASPVNEGATICSSCGLSFGTPQESLRICTPCKAPLEQGAMFCTQCGARQQ
jgi:hypothetical protein